MFADLYIIWTKRKRRNICLLFHQWKVDHTNFVYFTDHWSISDMWGTGMCPGRTNTIKIMWCKRWQVSASRVHPTGHIVSRFTTLWREDQPTKITTKANLFAYFLCNYEIPACCSLHGGIRWNKWRSVQWPLLWPSCLNKDKMAAGDGSTLSDDTRGGRAEEFCLSFARHQHGRYGIHYSQLLSNRNDSQVQIFSLWYPCLSEGNAFNRNSNRVLEGHKWSSNTVERPIYLFFWQMGYIFHLNVHEFHESCCYVQRAILATRTPQWLNKKT